MNFFLILSLWVDVVLNNRSINDFWYYLNGCPPNDKLRRLLNGESFLNPTFEDMLDSWTLEGHDKEPTIQDYLDYKEKSKDLHTYWQNQKSKRVVL